MTDRSTFATAARVPPVAAALTLAFFSAAYRPGGSADPLLAALQGTGMRAGARAADSAVAAASGLPGPGEASGTDTALLRLFRRGGCAGLLRPAAGDFRGLPPSGDIITPALDAGVVVTFPDIEVGLVPVDGQWRAFSCPATYPTMLLRDVLRELGEAVQSATDQLMRIDVASSRGNPREALHDHMIKHAAVLPAGLPNSVTDLLSRADLLQSLLAVADGYETAAATATDALRVDNALRPLHAVLGQAQRTALALFHESLNAGTAEKSSELRMDVTQRQDR